MPCRSRGFAVSGTATAREIIDRLYALPFDEFTWERNQAERELRRAAQREQAEQAKNGPQADRRRGRSKPPRPRPPRPSGDVLQAAPTLRDAQVAGRGDLARAAQAEREEVEKRVGLGGGTGRLTDQAAAVRGQT